MATAAGLATLKVYEEEKLFERSDALAPHFEEAIHALKGLPNVIDIRNFGMMGAVEFAIVPGKPFQRVLDIFERCWKKGVYFRYSGSTIAVSPPFIIDKSEIDRMFSVLGEAILENSKL